MTFKKTLAIIILMTLIYWASIIFLAYNNNKQRLIDVEGRIVAYKGNKILLATKIVELELKPNHAYIGKLSVTNKYLAKVVYNDKTKKVETIKPKLWAEYLDWNR